MIITNLGEKFKEVLLHIEKIIKENNLNENLNYLAKGCSSTVYTYDNFAIKIFNGDKNSNMFRNEDYKFLDILKDSSYFPNLYAYKEGQYMIVDYIEGYNINNIDIAIKSGYFCDNIMIDNLTKIISKQIWDVVDICKKYNIIPCDLHPENIKINNKGELYIVDVGYFKEFSRDINKENYLPEEYIEFYYHNSYEDIFNTEEEVYYCIHPEQLV